MRQRVIDNRPEINTEITVDCPVTRRILAIILFICNVLMAINLWQIYQKTASPKPLALLVFFTVMISVAESGIPDRFRANSTVIWS